MSERSTTRKRREQGGASARANGRASGPVLQSGFLVNLDHSGPPTYRPLLSQLVLPSSNPVGTMSDDGAVATDVLPRFPPMIFPLEASRLCLFSLFERFCFLFKSNPEIHPIAQIEQKDEVSLNLLSGNY